MRECANFTPFLSGLRAYMYQNIKSFIVSKIKFFNFPTHWLSLQRKCYTELLLYIIDSRSKQSIYVMHGFVLFVFDLQKQKWVFICKENKKEKKWNINEHPLNKFIRIDFDGLKVNVKTAIISQKLRISGEHFGTQ